MFPTTLPGVISPFSVVAIQGLGVTLIVGMDLDEAAAAVADRLLPGDVVLIKASRATGLERLTGLIGGAAA